MIEVTGNLWTYPADVRVITTNGTVKKNGECVMGRGCAAEAKRRFPLIASELGDHIRKNGNVPCHFMGDLYDCDIITFPVKHQWFQRADPALIAQSAKTLLQLLEFEAGDITICLPRPGCGNGGLRWEDVKPILEPILDDRFHVITFPKER